MKKTKILLALALVASANSKSYGNFAKNCEKIDEYRLTSPGATTDQLRETCMLLSEIACLDKASVAFNLYNDLYDTWSTTSKKDRPLYYNSNGSKGDYNTNLFDNFNHLVSTHTQAFKEIETYIKKSLKAIETVESPERLKSNLKSLTVITDETKKKLEELQKADQSFLRMLNKEEKLALIVVPQFTSLGKDEACKSYLSEEVASIQKSLEKWQTEFGRLRGYVVAAAKKRETLMVWTNRLLRNSAFERYAQFVGEDYQTLKDEMLEALQLINLSIEVDRYWFEANRNGLADRMHTRHILFTLPKRSLTVTKHRLKQFDQKLSEIAKLHGSDVDSDLKNSITSKIEVVERNLALLESRDWESSLAKQVNRENKRLNVIDRYVEGCKKRVEDFLQAASETKDQIAYNDLEHKYYALSLLCKRR